MCRIQFECSNGRHGRLGTLERLVRITQAAASLPPSRSCRPITLLLRGDTRPFQICSRKPRIPTDAGRSARSHARTKSVRLADHHIVHKVSTRQLVEFSHGTPYQACSPPCSLRSYPSDCECLLNERGEYPVRILPRSSHADRRFAIPQGRPLVLQYHQLYFNCRIFHKLLRIGDLVCVYSSNASPVDVSDVYAHSAAPDSSLPVRWWNVTRYSLQTRREKMCRIQFECSNGRHGRLGRLERLVRITQAAASLPPSRSCRPITLLLRGDTRQFQICSRRPRIPKDAGRSARSHARPKSVRLADHHIVHKVSTRQLVEFLHGSPYQACSPPCSLRSYPSDCECLLNERGEYPVKTFGRHSQSLG